jgi:hypothetical protein
VNEDLGHANLLGELEESIEVSLLGVDTSMANKALAVKYHGQPPKQLYDRRETHGKMKTAVAILGPLKSLDKNFVLVQLALLDSLVYSDDVLVHDASSANVEMADLRVAHEALRQTNGSGRSLELGVAVLTLGKAIHDRGFGVCDGISVLGRLSAGDTPSVNDD